MQNAQSYLEIVNQRGQRGLELQRVYRHLQNKELYLQAYGKLYANKGATTPGINPQDTVDGMDLTTIENIITSLKNGQYKWSPIKRKHIPKANGKTRPLGVSGWKDKLLQEVIRQILSAYYEPQFSDKSHGFRPSRGCHTALNTIRHQWIGTKWFIEGDIQACFD
jgi:retron-type reverse transcriptase